MIRSEHDDRRMTRDEGRLASQCAEELTKNNPLLWYLHMSKMTIFFIVLLVLGGGMLTYLLAGPELVSRVDSQYTLGKHYRACRKELTLNGALLDGDHSNDMCSGIKRGITSFPLIACIMYFVGALFAGFMFAFKRDTIFTRLVVMRFDIFLSIVRVAMEGLYMVLIFFIFGSRDTLAIVLAGIFGTTWAYARFGMEKANASDGVRYSSTIYAATPMQKITKGAKEFAKDVSVSRSWESLGFKEPTFFIMWTAQNLTFLAILIYLITTRIMASDDPYYYHKYIPFIFEVTIRTLDYVLTVAYYVFNAPGSSLRFMEKSTLSLVQSVLFFASIFFVPWTVLFIAFSEGHNYIQ